MTHEQACARCLVRSEGGKEGGNEGKGEGVEKGKKE
jgi:hypothetical protein